MIKIEELQSGDIVYASDVSRYPMRVTGIYDGVVRLDFTGNASGPWEVSPDTLYPIPITEELLKSMGMSLSHHYPDGFSYTDGGDVEIHFLEPDDVKWRLYTGKVSEHAFTKITNLHDLQNKYLEYFHKILQIDDQSIIGVNPKAKKELSPEEQKQLNLDKRYLRMAFIWAENSHAKRRQVASFIVKDKMIVSDGYNGTPSGFNNVCEDDSNKTKDVVLHAEANAITKLAKYGNSSKGATIYITDEPCIDCAKLIIQAGIKRVVYCREYRIHRGIEVLKEAQIKVDHVELEDAPVVPCP